MSLLDLAYITVPPGLALAIAGFIVWTGNRSTAALDAEIAAYRARKAAAMVIEEAPQPVATETTSAERVVSSVAPAIDAAAMARFYEELGLGRRPAAAKPDVLVTSDGRTYLVEGKVGRGSTVSAAVMRQAAIWGRTRNKRRPIKPIPAAVTERDAARTFTPR